MNGVDLENVCLVKNKGLDYLTQLKITFPIHACI